MADAPLPDDTADAAPVDPPASQPDADTFDSSIREFETATAPQPVAQPRSATDTETLNDLDALLEEFSQPTGPGQSPLFTHGADAHQQAQAQQLAEQKFNEYVQRAEYQRQEIEAAHKIVTEDHRRLREEFSDLRDVDLDRFYNERLQQNPNYGVAFFNRHRNPHAFHVVHQRLLSEFRQEWKSRPDVVAKADHDAVAAAVRGSSGKAQPEPPPNFGNMSDAELRRYTKTNFGF
jgi:hypothetical protein